MRVFFPYIFKFAYFPRRNLGGPRICRGIVSCYPWNSKRILPSMGMTTTKRSNSSAKSRCSNVQCRVASARTHTSNSILCGPVSILLCKRSTGRCIGTQELSYRTSNPGAARALQLRYHSQHNRASFRLMEHYLEVDLPSSGSACPLTADLQSCLHLGR